MDQNKFARWSFRAVLSILLITCFLPGSVLSNIRQRYQSTSITNALPAGTTVTTISYGSDARQKIQLFQRPIPFKDKSIYLAVYIPGGAWKDHKEGWQEEYNRTELLLLLENYVHVAYIDFRPTLDGQRWPAQELDWIAAFEILQKYLKPAGIVGWGHSAGAHGILTLAAHPSIGPLFQALVAKSAPSDLRDSPDFWIRLFGNPDPAMALIIEASPYFKAGSITADTLIIHGEMDQMVSYHQSVNLYYAILENGGRSDLILLENANHIFKPFEPDLSVELSSEEIAEATTCYMLDKLLLKHPECVRKRINNNSVKLNQPNSPNAFIWAISTS